MTPVRPPMWKQWRHTVKGSLAVPDGSTVACRYDGTLPIPQVTVVVVDDDLGVQCTGTALLCYPADEGWWVDVRVNLGTSHTYETSLTHASPTRKETPVKDLKVRP